MALYDTDLKAFRTSLPEGVTFEKDGSLEWSEKSMTYIVGAMPMMVFFVLMILMFELGNIPKLIMAVVTGPLGLIGAILTLLVTRQAIGFVAIIGFVALSGMVIRNSIILWIRSASIWKAGRPRMTRSSSRRRSVSAPSCSLR